MTHGVGAFLNWLSSVPDWMWFLVIAHMVATAPTPKNVWLQWILGGVKFFVGQRITAANAWNGMQSEVTAVTAAQKAALESGSTMEVIKTPNGVLKPIHEEKQR